MIMNRSEKVIMKFKVLAELTDLGICIASAIVAITTLSQQYDSGSLARTSAPLS